MCDLGPFWGAAGVFVVQQKHGKTTPRAPSIPSKKVRTWGVFRNLSTFLVSVFGALGQGVLFDLEVFKYFMLASSMAPLEALV